MLHFYTYKVGSALPGGMGFDYTHTLEEEKLVKMLLTLLDFTHHYQSNPVFPDVPRWKSTAKSLMRILYISLRVVELRYRFGIFRGMPVLENLT